MQLNRAVREALEAGNLAHLVTLEADGTPQVTVVWVGLEGDEIVCGHIHRHRKVRNIQRDARVALSMVTGGQTNGLDNYLVINGRAHVTEGGAPALLNKLAQVYIGPGTKFIPDGEPEGYITHIAVESISGVGPWKE